MVWFAPATNTGTSFTEVAVIVKVSSTDNPPESVARIVISEVPEESD